MQSADGVRLDGAGDSFVLTFADLSPVTLAFTDRPERDARSIASTRFIAGWNGLFDADPPNAVLVLARDEEEIPLTIRAVRYAGRGETASYVVAPLDARLGELARATDLGPASLFIDDAPDPEEIDPAQESTSVLLETLFVTADTISVQYTGLNGNRPATFGNSIVMWPATAVPWGDPPAATVTIEDDAAVGQVTFSGLQPSTTSYVFGYATGAAATTIAATVLVPTGGTSVGSSVQLQIADLGASSLTLEFTLPQGADPAAFGHWVGVWQGESLLVPPLAADAVAQATVAGASAQGQVSLDAVFERGTSYTAGYFTGPAATDLAATATFFGE